MTKFGLTPKYRYCLQLVSNENSGGGTYRIVFIPIFWGASTSLTGSSPIETGFLGLEPSKLRA